MPVVVVNAGLVEQLEALRTGYLLTARFRLFQNDWHPKRGDTIAQVEECNFSGYTSNRLVSLWAPAALDGDQAVTSAVAPVVWAHSGGPVGNWVFGYCAVNAAGGLLWAQRDPDAPLLMTAAGNIYAPRPKYAARSQFGQ